MAILRFELNFLDSLTDYQRASARQVQPEAEGNRQEAIGFPGVLEVGEAEAHLAGWLRRAWHGRDGVGLRAACGGQASRAGWRVPRA